jgi:hypothetical protein
VKVFVDLNVVLAKRASLNAGETSITRQHSRAGRHKINSTISRNFGIVPACTHGRRSGE